MSPRITHRTWRHGLLGLFALLVSTAASAPQDSLLERRNAAESLVESLESGNLEFALTRLEDRDDQVRLSLIAYLGKVELSDADASRRRTQRLAELARHDASARARLAAIDSLVELADEEALAALFELLSQTSQSERRAIAGHLGGTLYSRSIFVRERIEGLILEAFSSSGASWPNDVLAGLLPSYGRCLADRESGGALPRERAPILIAQKHSDPQLRRAAQLSLNLMLARLRELGQDERADRALERFAQDGVLTRPLEDSRVLQALEAGGSDPELALAGARRLAKGPFADDYEAGSWRVRSSILEANALIALGRLEAAMVSLRRAGDGLDGLIARRFDRTAKTTGTRRQRDLLLDRAMVGFTVAFVRIASGAAPDDFDVLSGLRGVHGILLEAQLLALGVDGVAESTSLQPLFTAPLSPYRLVFAQRAHEAWPKTRCLDLRFQLGRALATVSARELPGFEPFADLVMDPTDRQGDRLRASLLERISNGELMALRRLHDELQIQDLGSVEVDPERRDRMLMLRVQMQILGKALRDETLAERFFDIRQVSREALVLAATLSEEGQNLRSRRLLERMQQDVDGGDLRQRHPELRAEIELAIGASWSDEGQPAEAEKHMKVALDIFEGMRARPEEAGNDQLVAVIDGEIAGALVALAVNANVQAKDPEKALGYFERAYALRQDDFMRILLACYRARSGRAEEARELIREVPESPNAYYNLACTYALLGEANKALELLEADFEVNRQSPGALEKQKEWARNDPDLAPLRQDPRFEWLTAALEDDPEEGDDSQD